MKRMEKESDFFKRIYVNCDWNVKVLVWPTEKAKNDLNTKIKPEMWDLQTCRNYLEYLRENETH